MFVSLIGKGHRKGLYRPNPLLWPLSKMNQSWQLPMKFFN